MIETKLSEKALQELNDKFNFSTDKAAEIASEVQDTISFALNLKRYSLALEVLFTVVHWTALHVQAVGLSKETFKEVVNEIINYYYDTPEPAGKPN